MLTGACLEACKAKLLLTHLCVLPLQIGPLYQAYEFIIKSSSIAQEQVCRSHKYLLSLIYDKAYYSTLGSHASFCLTQQAKWQPRQPQRLLCFFPAMAREQPSLFPHLLTPLSISCAFPVHCCLHTVRPFCATPCSVVISCTFQFVLLCSAVELQLFTTVHHPVSMQSTCSSSTVSQASTSKQSVFFSFPVRSSSTTLYNQVDQIATLVAVKIPPFSLTGSESVEREPVLLVRVLASSCKNWQFLPKLPGRTGSMAKHGWFRSL